MQDTQPFLAYRDRIGVPSEIAFLRRQYSGFHRLQPVWIGRTLLQDAARIGKQRLRLGGEGLSGSVQRLLFRHLEWLPAIHVPRAVRLLHAQFARGGALALPLARQLGLRMVVTLHGGDISKQKNWHGTMLARRWPDVLQLTDRFVCVSGAVAEAAAVRGVPSDKLTVLPIGVEIQEHVPARNPAAYLFVGRFVPKKGIEVLASAMRILRAKGDQTPLVCVGDGLMRPLLEDLARDLPGITLTGWLGADAVRAQIDSAIALVVPSIVADNGDAEGLPSVVFEAMAQGCPVIGSDQGGIAEAVRHEKTGLLVPANDPAALATAMQRMAEDLSFGGILGLAGFKEAAKNFNAATQSAKLEDLLLSLT